MMKINLYIETVAVLEENDKVLDAIFWVGTTEATIDIVRFLEVARDTEYDNGWGGAEIASDLIIVGADWWLSRGEYDGSEWWTYNTCPQRPKRRKTKFGLIGDCLFESDYRGYKNERE